MRSYVITSSMRNLYLLPLFIAFGLTSNAQVNSANYCGHSLSAKQMAEAHPERAATINKSKTESNIQQNLQKDVDEIYIIPVVFHVIHDNGPENISEEQIQDALRVLNRDFRAQNPDTAFVATPFQGLPADVKIEFRLALRAPDGTCFNGITRTASPITNGGMGEGLSMVQAVIDGNNVYQGIWPHAQYMNVFVANDISAAGYTYYPNEDATPSLDNMYYNGIFMMAEYTGSIGTSDESKSRVLTHEVGHWLNLAHIWGDYGVGDTFNCGPDLDDYVEDTPDCTGTSGCELYLNSCDDDDAYWGIPMVDNVENYMEYSYCSKMFTLGQTTRMRNAIISDIGGRLNLWTEENLNQTGVLSGVSFCNINFEADRTALCSGTSVHFEPSVNQGIATYSWTFSGGIPNTSTDEDPTVTYPANGNYDVTLTVTSQLDGTSYSIEKTTYITVGNTLPTFEAIGPFCEGDQVPTLPSTSLNGLHGTWNPSVINNQLTQSYTFTPAVDECAADVYEMSITINSLPDVDMNTLPQLCVYDQPIQLTQGSPANGGYFGDGIVGGYFIPESAGIGTTTITYIYTNSFGCSASASITFEVNECLGIDDSELSISMLPNPFISDFQVVAKGISKGELILLDQTGRKVYQSVVTEGSTNIKTNTLSSGNYTVIISDENQRVYRYKLVKL